VHVNCHSLNHASGEDVTMLTKACSSTSLNSAVHELGCRVFVLIFSEIRIVNHQITELSIYGYSNDVPYIYIFGGGGGSADVIKGKNIKRGTRKGT
jgi:hypothetical protein